MAYSLKGKTALVTGAGSGICFAFAQALISRGCNVLIADLALRPEAQALVDETKGKEARAVFVKTDVSKWADLEGAVQKGADEFGGIDVFCPGAGVFEPPWSHFWNPPGSEVSADLPTSDNYKTYEINLVHPTRLTQLAISHLLARKKPGCILHISSIAAQAPTPLNPLYAVTKAGITMLIKSLGPLQDKVGIRVVGVSPGVVRTPLFFENKDKMRYVDEGKDVWVTPEEVAAVMVGLVEGEDVNGGTLIEVAAQGATRKVEMLNDPGPGAGVPIPGITCSNLRGFYDEVWEKLAVEGWGSSSAPQKH